MVPLPMRLVRGTIMLFMAVCAIPVGPSALRPDKPNYQSILAPIVLYVRIYNVVTIR